MSIRGLISVAVLLLPQFIFAQTVHAALPAPDASLQYLLKSLSDKDSKVARDAENDLIKIGNRAVPYLLETAAGRREGHPESAIQTIGKIGDPRAVYPLIQLLQTSDDYKIRSAAATSLGRIGTNRAVDALMKTASPSEQYVRPRLAALEALGHIKDPRAFTFLMLIMNTDTELDCRNRAADALDEIAGTQYGHDHHKRMEWLRAHHPEWLELNEEQWSIHPGMIWMIGSIGAFGVIGILVIRWALR